MAYPKNQRGALMALAASAGLWAWQNRDKISTWVKQQKSQMAQRQQPSMQQPSGSYTGSTRRFDEPSTTGSRPDVVLGDSGRDI
jgi:hypothetical protein